MAVQPPRPPPVDINKALGAGGATLLGGAVARFAAHLINAKWPGLIDAESLGDLTSISQVVFAFAGAYFTPHRT